MPRLRPDSSPRLRAGPALALVILTMGCLFFGLPARQDRQAARAQTPPVPLRRPARAGETRAAAASAVPVPVPELPQRIDLSRQTAAAAAAKSAGCIPCHRGQHDPHGKRDRPARLHRLPRRRPADRRPAAAPTSGRGSPTPGGRSGNPGPVLHAAEPRVARVRPLRQPRRPARSPT